MRARLCRLRARLDLTIGTLHITGMDVDRNKCTAGAGFRRRRDAGDGGVRRHVVDDDRTGADQRAGADAAPGDDRRADLEPGELADAHAAGAAHGGADKRAERDGVVMFENRAGVDDDVLSDAGVDADVCPRAYDDVLADCGRKRDAGQRVNRGCKLETVRAERLGERGAGQVVADGDENVPDTAGAKLVDVRRPADDREPADVAAVEPRIGVEEGDGLKPAGLPEDVQHFGPQTAGAIDCNGRHLEFYRRGPAGWFPRRRDWVRYAARGVDDRARSAFMPDSSRRTFLRTSAVFAAWLGLGRMRALAQEAGAQATQPSTGPTTRPAGDSGMRRPEQAEILRGLLSRQDRPVPVPIEPKYERLTPSERGIGLDGQPLLPEGTFVVERPGRIERAAEGLVFALHYDPAAQQMRRFRLLPCQLLETIENELTGGYEDFIVSGEITRYRGENYLLLRKVLRRTAHGNLSP